MRIINIFITLSVIAESYIVAINYLKETKLINKILETLILITMLITCYLVLHNNNLIITLLSLVFIIYTFIRFLIELKKTNISVLSIKDAIDMSETGILFLKDENNILLINNQMRHILNKLKIHKNYYNDLINASFRKLDNYYLIKCEKEIYQLKANSKKEITLLNITDIYKLQEKEELQNKLIEENNKKILETIKNINEIEKAKNLLKIKNEYHDELGYKLAILKSYLDMGKRNKDEIRFILDNLNNSQNDIDSLIKIYSMLGINIYINGKLPKKEPISKVLFEIIREAVTNAIIHANSKNIKIEIIEKENQLKISIINDGKKCSGTILESEGIKGMRRKLSQIKGELSISNEKEFALNITI